METKSEYWKIYTLFQTISILLIPYLIWIHFLGIYTPYTHGGGMYQSISNQDLIKNILLIFPLQIIYMLSYSKLLLYHKEEKELTKPRKFIRYWIMNIIFITQIGIIAFGAWFFPMIFLYTFVIVTNAKWMLCIFSTLLVVVIIKVLAWKFDFQKGLQRAFDYIYMIVMALLCLFLLSGRLYLVFVISVLMQCIPFRIEALINKKLLENYENALSKDIE